MYEYMELQLFKKINNLYEFMINRLNKRRLTKKQEFLINQHLTMAVIRVSDGYSCGVVKERLNYYKGAELNLKKFQSSIKKFSDEGRVSKKDFNFCVSKASLLLKIVVSLEKQLEKESQPKNKLLKFSFIN